MHNPNATSDNWPNLNSLVRKLEQDSITLGRIKESLQEFLELTVVYESFESSWGEYEALKQELEIFFHRLSEGSNGITQLGKTGDIRVELAHIRRYPLIKSHNEHWTQADDSHELLVRYRRINILLKALLLNIDPSACDVLDKDVGLETLRLLPGNYKAARAVASDPYTHSAVRRLQSWMENSPSGAVCWVPGTRRTGVSRALCVELDVTHRLGASLFFSSGNHNFSSIIPSIAYQLAAYSTPFRLALLNSNLQASSESPNIQFEELIAGPLTKVREALPANLAVVIDITDECVDVRPILDTILAKSKDLPIKFFVFSRPESYNAVEGLFVHEIDSDYTIEGAEGELMAVLKPFGFSESQLVEFVQRAGVLFACAATATHFVGGDTFSLSPTLFDSGQI